MVCRMSILLACLPFAVLTAQQARPTRARAGLGDVRIIKLHSGSNAVDLNGDGRADVVFMAFRDNGNAHGFEVITFYLADSAELGQWRLVPLYDSARGREMDAYRTVGGADCQLENLMIVRPRTSPHAPVELVLAVRDFGDTYAAVMPVTFTVYGFVADTTGPVGYPPYYFRAIRTVRSTGRYCDVFDAFEHELGLGHYPGPP